jgi:hypothetical protein
MAAMEATKHRIRARRRPDQATRGRAPTTCRCRVDSPSGRPGWGCGSGLRAGAALPVARPGVRVTGTGGEGRDGAGRRVAGVDRLGAAVVAFDRFVERGALFVVAALEAGVDLVVGVDLVAREVGVAFAVAVDVDAGVDLDATVDLGAAMAFDGGVTLARFDGAASVRLDEACEAEGRLAEERLAEERLDVPADAEVEPAGRSPWARRGRGAAAVLALGRRAGVAAGVGATVARSHADRGRRRAGAGARTSVMMIPRWGV